MILVNGNWEQIYDFQDVSTLIREYYNRDLADELDKLIDETNQDFQCELREKEDKISELENDIIDLELDVQYLRKQVEELENKINETK